jgi:POT family proton-dependent oligopeptide transporter
MRKGDMSEPFRQPAGLATLFFTEMWERFSYYGMRAILVLFMVAPPAEGGLGFATRDAASLYGTYTMAVYMVSIVGGLAADRFLGASRAVLIGGIIIACGHFTMAVHSLTSFYTGLALIVIGTGLLKPNISTMVGSLYAPDDRRRDSGFSIFYMGINIGAVMAPLVCGWLAESATFKAFLAARGYDPAHSWHWAFAAAGFGMLAGLVVFWFGGTRLPSAGPGKRIARDATPRHPLTAHEWRRVLAIGILFTFTIMFWSAYEQKGASLNLFAKELVSRSLFGWNFPASWLQSLTPFFVIVLAPLFARLWIRLGDRQPSSARKFALGLFAIGIAMLLLVPASALTAHGRISPMWLVAVYFFDVVGELCVSPVGLSMVTRLSPARIVGVMMGAWFFATSLGNKLAGYFSGFFTATDAGALVQLYGGIAAMLMGGALVLAMIAPRLERMAQERRSDGETGLEPRPARRTAID